MTGTVVDTALLKSQLEVARALRQRFTACCADVAVGGSTADAAADAIATHLASTKGAELPTAAQTLWLARIVRPLRADAARPLAPRAIASIRSWPSARVAELAAALAAIEAILVDAENEVHHEVIYAEISRAYS